MAIYVPVSPNKIARSKEAKPRTLPSMKNLPLASLKELIEEIYSTKKDHDLKCIEINQVVKSLDQYLLYYLNQKYGLKHLVDDWYSSITSAALKYRKDPEVKLFYLILTCEVEEKFTVFIKNIK